MANSRFSFWTSSNLLSGKKLESVEDVQEESLSGCRDDPFLKKCRTYMRECRHCESLLLFFLTLHFAFPFIDSSLFVFDLQKDFGVKKLFEIMFYLYEVDIHFNLIVFYSLFICLLLKETI